MGSGDLGFCPYEVYPWADTSGLVTAPLTLEGGCWVNMWKVKCIECRHEFKKRKRIDADCPVCRSKRLQYKEIKQSEV